MKGRFAITLIFSALLLSGCTTWSLEELRRTTPSGSAFQNALSQRYLDFANSEVEQYDWWSQMHFADKGLMAAYGKDVEPEDLADWTISEHALASLEKARASLMAARTPEAMEKHPELLADAQYNFDCWVEQQQENWQDDDIAHCRDGFAVAMQKLAGTYKEEPKAAAEEAAHPEPVHMPTPLKAQDVRAYVVFFEWNQSVMSAQGMKVTGEVIDLLKDESNYEVVLNGHSDTAESRDNDFDLSQRRADAVRQRLVSGGIKEDAIKVFAFGSSDPHVKTGPGVKEPANRRVEIFLND